MKDDYTIELPIIKESVGHKGLLSITKSSPREHREALELTALFFKREFNYTHLQFCANEHIDQHVEYHGFAFTESALSAIEEGDSETPTRILGGGCFRKRKFSDGESWILDWVWVHPYARNSGLFTKHIGYFKETFGEFFPEHPISKAMRHIFDNKVRK
jgi:hypothetical protein